MSGSRLFASQAVLDQLEDISMMYSRYMGLLKDGENDGLMTFDASQTLQSEISQLIELVRVEILEHGRPSPVDAGPANAASVAPGTTSAPPPSF